MKSSSNSPPLSASPPAASPPHGASLARVLGLPGAVLMGLGSIVGTGIFVSIGTAAGVAGSAVLVAVGLAAIVATCNGLSSAQLAAAHPVSGGVYEQAYRYATPTLGRIAGFAFVSAKTASAATAALGCAGYALALASSGDRTVQIVVAAMVVVVLTIFVAGGMQRSSRLNAVVVALTLVSLLVFVVAGLPHVDVARLNPTGYAPSARAPGADDMQLGSLVRDIAHATALMFVAYTGYGRIATLGEEVREPARTIPRAIIVTLVVALLLYLAVTTVAIGSVGADGLAAATRAGSAPLETIAAGFGEPIRYIVAAGAITAMLGVLLNLLLGISRVVLAMARRRDLPHGLATVHGSSPRRAVIVTGVAIAALALIGSVKTTWSVSAFFVLVYYGIANYCALRQPASERRFTRAVPVLGLVSCLALAVWLVIDVLSP
ncbi:MAG TPA: APC family permease [Kofleriaceae bacterium]|nr:APC family permease [Kofleriaceae bacterium]